MLMSRGKVENFVRKVREALGLNQHEFAAAVGRSYASVQGYEAGKRLPLEVEERIRQLASERGIVIDPPAKHSTRPGDQQAKWHTMLEEVLDSGESDCIAAVQSNLAVFTSTVRSRRQLKSLRKKHS
jgi:transcriptional regulator with XRE-family HTH domain